MATIGCKKASVDDKEPAVKDSDVIELDEYEFIEPKSNPIYSFLGMDNNNVIYGGEKGLNYYDSDRVSSLKKTTKSPIELSPKRNVSGIPITSETRIFAIEKQKDGKILIGGYFGGIKGTTMNSIARLNSDQSIDETFSKNLYGVNGEIYAISVQNNGKILVGGYFTSIHGQNRNHIARLNPDGSLDQEFAVNNQGFYGTVNVIKVVPDGQIIVGGYFRDYNGIERKGVVKLNADGSLNKKFKINFNLQEEVEVFTLSLSEDGGIYIGGRFGEIDGIPVSNIAKLNENGSLDEQFMVNDLKGQVYSLEILPGRKILIGGNFIVDIKEPIYNIALLNSNGGMSKHIQKLNMVLLPQDVERLSLL